MDKIRAFYADKKGHRPENVGVVRLREEDAEALVEDDGIDSEAVERLAGSL
jgi:hypothetical protein